jgi:hypothetical protein
MLFYSVFKRLIGKTGATTCFNSLRGQMCTMGLELRVNDCARQTYLSCHARRARVYASDASLRLLYS